VRQTLPPNRYADFIANAKADIFSRYSQPNGNLAGGQIKAGYASPKINLPDLT
jgi:hypothetical protein